jgi:hypothetical protein
MGRLGLLEHGYRRSTRGGRPFRDYGPDGAEDAAAKSAGAAVPFGDYGPAGATQQVMLNQQLLLRYGAFGVGWTGRRTLLDTYIWRIGDQGPTPLACSWK